MVFSSTLFLFLFLPGVLTLYLLVPWRLKNFVLLCASLLFYAWGEVFYFLIMLASILLNYAFGLLVHRSSGRTAAKLAMAGGVAANLALLGYFKYANFLGANVGALLSSLGMAPLEFERVHLPIGISFFTFQGMSYMIDVYRKEAPVQRNPLHIALYISLFPQLIAGPIVRYHDVALQIMDRVLTADAMAYGVKRFTMGLAKKVLLANTVAVAADNIFALPPNDLTAGAAWLGLVCYTLQIYFDFSGYSDMAVGLGHMFGFTFMENFQWPYISQSIREFWRRWHISLSTWFRDYLYVPLGGNRCAPWRTYLNLVIVFFLCGLWHGASWNFVIWGLYHGFFLVLERSPAGRLLDKMWRPLRHAYVLLVVLLGWVFFRADTMPHALEYLVTLFGGSDANPVLHPWREYLQNDTALALAFGVLGAMPVIPALHAGWTKRTGQNRSLQALRLTAEALSCATLLLLCAMTLSAGTHNPFIYFRF